jgi:hypothetical protein
MIKFGSSGDGLGASRKVLMRVHLYEKSHGSKVKMCTYRPTV